MKIPYVIDNRKARMADVLAALLEESKCCSMDTATAFFNVGGYDVIRDGLKGLGSFRLLIGREIKESEKIGLVPDTDKIARELITDVESLPFDEATLKLVEDLIEFLGRDSVAVRVSKDDFQHSKCYLFYSDKPVAPGTFDRMRPLVGIVGSSNFTRAGLTSNKELNVSHKIILDHDEIDDHEARALISWHPELKGHDLKAGHPERRVYKSEVGARALHDLANWYDGEWILAHDFKQQMIDLLDASKFGQKEYTPFQIYMKSLYARHKDDIEEEAKDPGKKTAVDLATFQEHAVIKAKKILRTHYGVLIGDSTGLGKTWIGKRLLEDYAYHMRQKALVVCPASLRDMWTNELKKATISATVLSQEELGREEFDVMPHLDSDIVLVDESHNFRNPGSQRYLNLDRILTANAGRGKAGQRKRIILMSATPVNNDLFDLYNQLNLIAMNDRTHFAAAGVGDMYRYFLNARRTATGKTTGGNVETLLDMVAVRRTRSFIKHAYPDATLNGDKIRWPERKLHTLKYDIEAVYNAGAKLDPTMTIYESIVAGIENLELAPYNLESFKKDKTKIDPMALGRQEALVGITKTRYLKRFESSIQAFRISVKRALYFLKTFESYILDGKILGSSDFYKLKQYIDVEEEDDSAPTSVAGKLDESEEAKKFLETLPPMKTGDYDLRGIHEAIQTDITILTKIWEAVKDVTPDKDAKLIELKKRLTGDLKGKKVLLFSYFKDTSKYLYENLAGDNAKKFLKAAGNPNIKEIDSTTKNRGDLIKKFAPVSNEAPELQGTEDEIQIMISTDVLSEGQNLQDCGIVLNYDLHWNPMRMVQRAGRIDRMRALHQELHIYNMWPDDKLDRLLGLVENLNNKIAQVDSTGFHDTSVLGESAHPKVFNTLRRIRDEDGAVVDEIEEESDLASGEFAIEELRRFLFSGGEEQMKELPDGIHSGLERQHCRGMFFHFYAKPKGADIGYHFLRYYDAEADIVVDNALTINGLIACKPDTPRVLPKHPNPFAAQEKVLASIMNAQDEAVGAAAAPPKPDPMQNIAIVKLQEVASQNATVRKDAVDLAKFLSKPLGKSHLRVLSDALEKFYKDNDQKQFLDKLKLLRKEVQGPTPAPGAGKSMIMVQREDIRLICFDYLT